MVGGGGGGLGASLPKIIVQTVESTEIMFCSNIRVDFV